MRQLRDQKANCRQKCVLLNSRVSICTDPLTPLVWCFLWHSAVQTMKGLVQFKYVQIQKNRGWNTDEGQDRPLIQTPTYLLNIIGTRRIPHILHWGMNTHPSTCILLCKTLPKVCYMHEFGLKRQILLPFLNRRDKENPFLTEDEGSSSLGIITRYPRTLPASPGRCFSRPSLR